MHRVRTIVSPRSLDPALAGEAPPEDGEAGSGTVFRLVGPWRRRAGRQPCARREKAEDHERGERTEEGHGRVSRDLASEDAEDFIWGRDPRPTHADSASMTRAYPATPRVGVLAVVRRGERFLLVRRRNPPDAGKWGFPGGAQELGETVAAAAARELREETGVGAEPHAILDVIDVIQRDADGRVQFHYALVAVLMEWREGEGAAADDIDALAWVSIGEIARLHCSDRVGAVAAKALGVAASPSPSAD